MKGERSLASEFNRRRCRTVKDHRRGVSGRFLLRPAEIAGGGQRTLCPGGSLGHTTMIRGVTTSSDVTDRMKAITNPGRTIAAAVVGGAWSGVRVIQTLWSGSGA